MNFAARSKLPPYLPVFPLDGRALDGAVLAAELGRREPEVRLLQDAGMNVVRLLVIWKAIEPDYGGALPEQLPPAGRAYLESLRRVVDALYAHGVYVILDFHQDIVNEAFGGEGFPDWAVAVDADHPRPPSPPPPDAMWGMRYYPLWGGLADGVRHTLRSFWRNSLTDTERGRRGLRVQDHLVRTIGLTAAFFAGHPAVLGYEPFNEPHAMDIPKAAFERDVLRRFYGAVRAEVARRDPSAFVFPETRMDWAIYPADAPEPSLWRPWSLVAFTDHPRTFLDLRSDGPEARVAVSFHYYDAALVAGLPLQGRLDRRARAWPSVFAEMDAQVRGQGAVPFLTEFGCDQGWTEPSRLEPGLYGTTARACMDRQYREVEGRLWNATYWNYDLYSRRDAKGRVSENWNDEDMSLLGPDGPRNLDVASRPYPLRSSARPERLAFDLASGQGTIVLGGEVVAAPTIVFVPVRFHYARGGFEVRATSARAPEWDARRSLLAWWPDPGRARNVLVVSPAGGFDRSALPAEAWPLLSAATLHEFPGRAP